MGIYRNGCSRALQRLRRAGSTIEPITGSFGQLACAHAREAMVRPEETGRFLRPTPQSEQPLTQLPTAPVLPMMGWKREEDREAELGSSRKFKNWHPRNH